MIAFEFPITNNQANYYKPRSPGEIDVSSNKLIIRCDVGDVVNKPIRSGTVINKISGTPSVNYRNIRYEFVAQEWEFTAYFAVDIVDLISELEVAYPNGIPCKNYLAAKYGTAYLDMLIKFATIEAKGSVVYANGIYIPFSGFNVRIARMDIFN